MCHDGPVDTAADISQVTDAARAAARVLANATTQVKNRGLEAIAAALIDRSDQILAANAEDVARGVSGYDSDTLAEIAGSGTAELQAAGHEHPRPAIHRDDLAVLGDAFSALSAD